MLRKVLVLVIICFFIGISCLPSINCSVIKKSNLTKTLFIHNEKIGFKQDENSIIESGDGNTEYWAVIVSTNITNITLIYNSLNDKSNWNESHIIMLKRQEATRENILDALDWLALKSSSEDIVLFSHNGHGNHIKDRYGIVPWDKELIFTDELDEKFDKINCRGMCLIFDCCFSGSFIEGKPTTIDYGNLIQFQKSFGEGLDEQGRVILMSTLKKGTGVSATIQVDNNTRVIDFIRFVSEAFENGIDDNVDGWVSAEESFYYGRKKFLPYAIIFFFSPVVQLLSIIKSMGSIAIPFPTHYDGVNGDLPIVKV